MCGWVGTEFCLGHVGRMRPRWRQNATKVASGVQMTNRARDIILEIIRLCSVVKVRTARGQLVSECLWRWV